MNHPSLRYRVFSMDFQKRFSRAFNYFSITTFKIIIKCHQPKSQILPWKRGYIVGWPNQISNLFSKIGIRNQELSFSPNLSNAPNGCLPDLWESIFDHEKHSSDHRSNFVNHQTKRLQGKKVHQNKPKML